MRISLSLFLIVAVGYLYFSQLSNEPVLSAATDPNSINKLKAEMKVRNVDEFNEVKNKREASGSRKLPREVRDQSEVIDLPAFFGPLASRVWSVVMPFSAKC